MMKNIRRLKLGTWLLLALFLLFFVGDALAQEDNPACPALVDQALSTMGNSCAEMGRNSACYGHTQVDSTFTEVESAPIFNSAGDTADLRVLQSIQTTPLDLTRQEWGLAVMKIQANLPNSLPGQQATILLLGDVTVSNDVPAAEALQPGAGLPVVARTAASVFSQPTVRSSILTTAGTGTSMMADGISANLNWVRVVFNDQFGWVERSNLDAGEGLDALPQLDVEQTAMQAFHFQTGVGLPVCSQAPSTLAIEGPETVTVELTINGLDIRVGSFLTLQSMGVDGFVMTVQEGRVVLPDESRIEGGQATFFALDEHKDVIGWQQPRPATAEELALGMRVRRTLDALENPPAAAAAPVPVVVEEPTATPIATTSDCAFGPGPVTHRVAAGENLFRIALKYNTSLASIATANGISNVNRIITGSVLTIPNPCSGFVNVVVSTSIPPPPASSSGSTGSADCSGFRALSPLGGIPYGTADFSWTVVQGASHYRLNIYSANGDRVYSKETPDPSLRYVQTTTAAIGTTSNYSWDADAMYFGQVICTTPRVSGVTRAPAPPFSASWFCSNPGEVTVSYSGVPSGTTSVDIVFDDLVRQSIQGNFPVSGSSGSQSFIRVTTVSFGEVIALPSQQIADLPGSLTCG